MAAVFGARRWFVVIVGSSVALLGVLALGVERTSRSWWYPDAGRNGIDTALEIDTRGGPLVQVGDRGSGMPANGGAAPGYVVTIDARASRSSPITIHLVSPGGDPVWSRRLARGRHVHLPPTELQTAGIWRIELSAPGEVRQISVRGSFVGSPWSRVPGGVGLPVAWVLGGLVAAVSVWFGRRGARAAATSLVVLAFTLPFGLVTTSWVFRSSPGGPALLVLALGLTASAGITLGWTRPRPDSPSPRGVTIAAIIGASAAVAVFAVGADDAFCRVACRGNWIGRDFWETAIPGFAGLGMLGVSSWLVGRSTATSVPGRVRLVVLDAVGTVLALGALLVLGFGVFAAGFTAYGIGFGDQGPDPSAGLQILLTTLGLTALLVFAAITSFRFDHARSEGSAGPLRS